MSEEAPEGRDEPIPKAEALARVQALPVDFSVDEENERNYTTLEASDRTLHSLLYTGGETEYAHIYLAWMTGEYNGNRMLFLRYVWLSKPGAYESDMWGENGMNIRLVEGMPNPFSKATVSAMQRIQKDSPYEANYFEVDD